MTEVLRQLRVIYYGAQMLLLAPFVFLFTFVEMSPPAWKEAYAKGLASIGAMAFGLVGVYVIKINF